MNKRGQGRVIKEILEREGCKPSEAIRIYSRMQSIKEEEEKKASERRSIGSRMSNIKSRIWNIAKRIYKIGVEGD